MSTPGGAQSYQFGRFTLDQARGTLRAGDVDIALRPKSFAVLTILVERHGQLVEKDRLFRDVWPGATVTDDSLAQCLTEIRRALDDADRTLIRTVPRRGYMFDGPVTAVASVEAEPAAVAPEPDRRWLYGFVTATVVVAAIGVAVSVLLPTRNTEYPPVRSIAVLPFENRSANADDAYLVDGMQDDILTSLGRIRALRVISRTSVEQYADTTKTAAQIGKELGVDAILEGGMQRSGDDVRVNVQLIDTHRDAHLWVDQYDRELTAANVFSMQSEIARSVARALEVVLNADETARIGDPPTDNLEAYRAYLQGLQLLRRRTGASIDAAVHSFQEAVRLDQSFSLAHAGLADAYQLLTGYSSAAPEDVLPLALAAARKAIELDPERGEPYASLAMVYHEASRRGVELDRQQDPGALFERALELSPNYATAHQWYGEYLRSTVGRAAAIEQFRAALAIDPLSPILNHMLGRALETEGDYAEAEAHLKKAIDIDPGFSRAYQGLAVVYFARLARFADAAQAAHKAVVLNPRRATNLALLANIYLHMGDTERAQYWLEKAMAVDPNNPAAHHVRTFFHVHQQDFEVAIGAARSALERPDRFDSGFYLKVLRDDHLKADDVDAALRLYATELPECLEGEVQSLNPSSVWTAVDCALVLQRADKHEEAAAVFDRVREYIDDRALERNSELWLLLASIQTLEGDEESALNSLRTAYDRGWRRLGFYFFRESPAFERLRDRPEFQALADDYGAEMETQQRLAATRLGR